MEMIGRIMWWMDVIGLISEISLLIGRKKK